MLGNLYTDAARANWATVPGRTLDLVYDSNNNATKITFSDNNSVVYVQYLTYDANNNVTKVECKIQ